MTARTTITPATFIWILTFVHGMAHTQEVNWLRSTQQAAQVASSTGRPILVYVKSSGCYYCDMMQRNVWQDPSTIANITRNFVPLMLTREQNAATIASLNIKGYPVTLVFTSERKFLHRVDGYLAPDRLSAELQKAREIAFGSTNHPSYR